MTISILPCPPGSDCIAMYIRSDPWSINFRWMPGQIDDRANGMAASAKPVADDPMKIPPKNSFRQKPLGEQVIVLTGATSGIGLVTARMAAQKGARLVLVARNEEALAKLADEIKESGGEAIYISTDVSKESQVRRVADSAEEAFGKIDTWVNNAGVSIYGKLEDVPDADSRRLFETNFWGVVNGSLIAAKRMEKKGGTLINIGSALSDRAIPIQGMYSASKHAVKGFTDALRMELEAVGAPVLVSLVKPAAIDTPYKEHAKNYLGVQPQNPPPVYAPETAAETILYCAENPVRDVFVGGGGKALSLMGEHAPRITDLYMEALMIDMQKTQAPAKNSIESLFTSNDTTLTERGGYKGHVAESSLYTTASLHPVATGTAVALGLGAAFAVTRKILSSGKESPVVNQ
jgi:short-subunit dehydrogenase